MAKHNRVIPVALLAALLGTLCSTATVVVDDYFDDRQRSFNRCWSMLDKGAPKCYRDVYFTSFLPRDHVQCCKNYLKMDGEHHDCWIYLFDDPSTTFSMETNILRCKLELEPPVSKNNGTFVACRSEMNEGAPDCWEEVYYKHRLPKNYRRQCCFRLLNMYEMGSFCFAYLFDDPKSTLVLRSTINKCQSL